MAKSEVFSSSLNDVEDRIILKSFQTASNSKLFYEISVAACQTEGCPIQVQLLENQTVLDTLSLDWQFSVRKIQETPINNLYGAGDPLQHEYSLKAWTTGEEENSVAIVVRNLQLTNHQYGLLIHQSAGYEHVKRRHYLLVAKGKQLMRVWTGREPPGPHWSTVEIINEGKPADIFCHFSGFFYPTTEQADKLEVICYAWNAENYQLVKYPAKIYAVILDSYPSIAKARQVQVENSSCLSDYWVLPSKQFQLRVKNEIVLATLTANRSLAEKALKRVQSCAPKISGIIKSLKNKLK